MVSKHRPHRGSLGVLPRKRAKNIRPRIRSRKKHEEARPLGFSGYKAGMTHVIAVDETDKSPTNGMEVFLPVTIIETPPMTIVGARAYKKGYQGLEAFTDIWMKNPGKDVRKRAPIKGEDEGKKRLEKLKKEGLDALEDVKLIVYTKPALTDTPQKKPDIMEMPLGGDIEAKIDYAIEHLGEELKITDVFQPHEYVDVTSVTKGKGFQGVVKRYGVKLARRKSSKGRRHLGTGGAWTPSRKLWSEPLPGQMGYHTRTEYNKLVLTVDGQTEKINPKGGFLRYGAVKNDFIMLHGSVPGATKRIIRLSPAQRPGKNEKYDILRINTESKQGNR